ncbi:hypothetical protein B0H12DRAFT_1243516 [Mycena haematopus]|nr:hypothetical protein B0H12DRAFT_1243516 [Mycena haematopus]
MSLKNAYACYNNATLPWSNLTAFTAQRITAAECLRVLSDAPLLARCSFSVTAGPAPTNASPITHASLREFTLHGSNILSLLTLPNIRVLTTDTSASNDELGQFIKRSAESLREFSFTLPPTSNAVSIDWFWTARGLRTVSLLGVPSQFTSEFFQALRSEADAAGVPFLPQLRWLEIRQADLKADAAIVSALRSRWIDRRPNTVQLRSVRLVDSKQFHFVSLTPEYATLWNQLDASIDWDGLYDLGMEGMEVYVGSPETNFVWEW